MCVSSSASSGGDNSAGARMRSGARSAIAAMAACTEGTTTRSALMCSLTSVVSARRRLRSASIARMRGIVVPLFPAAPSPPGEAPAHRVRKGSTRARNSRDGLKDLEIGHFQLYYRAAIAKSLLLNRLYSCLATF